MRETREIYRKIKQEWEQKYATGVQWQTIAESAIQQQIERLRLDKELQQKKIESDNKRPAVVAPQDVGKDKQPPKEVHQKNSDEKETDKARRAGKPAKPGTPDQKQMDREHQEAVKAAANITRGVNGKQKVIKSEDERVLEELCYPQITKVKWGQYTLRRSYLGKQDVILDLRE